MRSPNRATSALIWGGVGTVLAAALGAAALSPLLAWRDPIYILAGFAGVLGLACLLIQPLLAGGVLPGLAPRTRLIWHRWVGASLVVLILLHVGGLWITSPPDVVDALLFRSPTPFSPWGVIAMWAVFLTACLAIIRRRLRSRIWHRLHLSLAAVIAGGTILHALLIEGTMELWTKSLLCALVALTLGKLLWDRRGRL